MERIEVRSGHICVIALQHVPATNYTGGADIAVWEITCGASLQAPRRPDPGRLRENRVSPSNLSSGVLLHEGYRAGFT